jgi:hypothetical protein
MMIRRRIQLIETEKLRELQYYIPTQIWDSEHGF